MITSPLVMAGNGWPRIVDDPELDPLHGSAHKSVVRGPHLGERDEGGAAGFGQSVVHEDLGPRQQCGQRLGPLGRQGRRVDDQEPEVLSELRQHRSATVNEQTKPHRGAREPGRRELFQCPEDRSERREALEERHRPAAEEIAVELRQREVVRQGQHHDLAIVARVADEAAYVPHRLSHVAVRQADTLGPGRGPGGEHDRGDVLRVHRRTGPLSAGGQLVQRGDGRGPAGSRRGPRADHAQSDLRQNRGQSLHAPAADDGEGRLAASQHRQEGLRRDVDIAGDADSAGHEHAEVGQREVAAVGQHQQAALVAHQAQGSEPVGDAEAGRGHRAIAERGGRIAYRLLVDVALCNVDKELRDGSALHACYPIGVLAATGLACRRQAPLAGGAPPDRGRFFMLARAWLSRTPRLH